MAFFEIAADIRRAKTLPSGFYTDERFFELSKERIFARSWQFGGAAGEVDGLKPLTLLPGFLDEPLLLTGNNNSIRCLSNVCTHRGKILVEQPCQANLIRCGYHGRRFSLDGKFLSMPEFEGVENFPSENDDLVEIPLARWGDFLFASLQPAIPFETAIGEAIERISLAQYGEAKLAAAKDYDVAAHWALYCENYLEGFHIPYVHHSLNEVIDYGSYRTETFRYTSLQTGLDKRGKPAAQYLFVFPNLMFNFYPWGISVNVVRPLQPDRTIVSFLTYTSNGSDTGSGAGADLHRVEMEDEAVVESVQKGIRSRFYTHGRYSPARERGTHHFHRLIAEFME